MASQRNSVFGKGPKPIFLLSNKAELISAFQKCHRHSLAMVVSSRLRRLLENCVKLSSSKSATSGQAAKMANLTNFRPKHTNRMTSSTSVLGPSIRCNSGEHPDIFTDGIQIDAATLRTIVSNIEGINFFKTHLNTKKVSHLRRLWANFSRAIHGQYFTSRGKSLTSRSR